jgi:hypothetical protein
MQTIIVEELQEILGRCRPLKRSDGWSCLPGTEPRASRRYSTSSWKTHGTGYSAGGPALWAFRSAFVSRAAAVQWADEARKDLEVSNE